jgi:hypothetical protein
VAPPSKPPTRTSAPVQTTTAASKA